MENWRRSLVVPQCILYIDMAVHKMQYINCETVRAINDELYADQKQLCCEAMGSQFDAF